MTFCQILNEGMEFQAVDHGSSVFVIQPSPCFSCFSSGKKLGFTIDNGKLHNVSLGQGQEVVAENALDVAAENGHWVILQVRGRGCPRPCG